MRAANPYLDKRVRVTARPCRDAVGVVADVKSILTKAGELEQFRILFEPLICVAAVGSVGAVWRRADEFEVVAG
jgi:hypothetical protein